MSLKGTKGIFVFLSPVEFNYGRQQEKKKKCEVISNTEWRILICETILSHS